MMSVNLEAAAGSRMEAYSGAPYRKPFFRGMRGRRYHSGDPVLFRHNGYGGGLCQFRAYDFKAGGLDYHGSKYRNHCHGQLIALDIGELAPFITFVGVALILFCKEKTRPVCRGYHAGLGILFIGMGMMGEAMVPLWESEVFVNLMTRFSNPLLGILAALHLQPSFSPRRLLWVSCRLWLSAA